MEKKKKSLYRQLLVRTILLLILPFLLVQVFLVVQIVKEGEKKHRVGIDLITERAVKIRQQHLVNIQKIENRITANQTLKGFFLVPFTSQNLQYYSSEILRIIKPGAGEEELYTIRIYYPNESIPRGFSTFYFLSDFAVGNASDFLDCEEERRWVLPEDAKAYNSLYTPYSQSYTYMKKVFAGERLVYVLTISVSEKDMDSFIWDEVEEFTSVEYAGTREAITADYSQGSSNVITQVFSFPDFPQSLIFIFSKNSQNAYMIATIIAVMLLIAGLIAVVLAFIRNIFQNIYLCLEEFEDSASHGFSYKLELDGNNEITRIKKAFNQQIDKIQELLEITKEQVALVKDSQLMALQHQINPHFLYNTLEVFSYKMELYHHYEDAEAVVAFSKMMRYNVVESNGYATIYQELEQVENYLCIQRMKYQKIVFETNIEDGLYEFEVPRFLLQPLIENSIIHGYYGEPLKIVLTCRAEGEYLWFQVWDNGQGIPPHMVRRINESLQNKCRQDGVGIGLMNIHSRLCLFYSDYCGLQIDSVQMEWTAMVFRIPVLNNGRDDQIE